MGLGPLLYQSSLTVPPHRAEPDVYRAMCTGSGRVAHLPSPLSADTHPVPYITPFVPYPSVPLRAPGLASCIVAPLRASTPRGDLQLFRT